VFGRGPENNPRCRQTFLDRLGPQGAIFIAQLSRANGLKDGGSARMIPNTPAMRREVAQLLALCKLNLVDWSLLAREAMRPDGLRTLLSGEITERRASQQNRRGLKQSLAGGLPIEAMEDNLSAWRENGLALTTVLDDDYPMNLRTISNLPPFLFYRGRLQADDAFSVAVVGTREPSREGIDRATSMARRLAQRGVTVLSGLARGIDTAAHEATLRAGGRTIAVLGSGLFDVYPHENRELADRIAKSGAVVSQFWPDAAPAKYNFPRRNVVTSGLGQGTLVIEASATSGAKMQARLALEHGKLVFIVKSLVDTHDWAKRYVKRGAVEVRSAGDVIDRLRSVEALRTATAQQRILALQFA
jgi:DNA processing protein